MVSRHIFLTISLFVLMAGLSLVASEYREYTPDTIQCPSNVLQSPLLSERRCLTTILDPVCPLNSHCRERDGRDGECNCRSGYVFNSRYTSDQEYCVVNNATISIPAAISISGPTTASEPPHHHIIGGILIPLVLVASFVGGAYIVVRYRVLQRVRDKVLGRRRRHRPTYHMGTEFDPPLI